MRGLLLYALLCGTASAGEYRLGASDVLELHVYNETDLSRALTVDGECDIYVGLVGSVGVCGLTATEVATEVAKRLSDGFLVAPQVTATVTGFNSQSVQVVGEVVNVGPINLSNETSLLEVIQEAGGPSADNIVQVRLMRPSGETSAYDLISLLHTSPVPVAHGDIVQLMPGSMVYVQGEVKSEGPVVYRDGLTVSQALATAGGPGEFASMRRVSVLRASGERLHVNLSRVNQGLEADVVLLPEDRLVVRRGAF